MRSIKLFLIIISLAMMVSLQAHAIDGRWDISVTRDEKVAPAWLEVYHSGFTQKVGRFVYIVGSSRPISKINVNGSNFSFAIPPQWDREDRELVVEGRMIDDTTIEGKVTQPDGKVYAFKGVRAPKLITIKDVKWEKPKKLFNGSNIDGWHADSDKNQWMAEKGILRNLKSGANLITNEKFQNFKLHIEFKIPKDGNSGIYLRGRHEVQVSDHNEASTVNLGAVYGFLKPLELPKTITDVWHSYDITLIGRVITVVLDGETIIHKAEIPGITGGALDSHEGEAGPIYLQGDHTSIEYRNITIAKEKK